MRRGFSASLGCWTCGSRWRRSFEWRTPLYGVSGILTLSFGFGKGNGTWAESSAPHVFKSSVLVNSII